MQPIRSAFISRCRAEARLECQTLNCNKVMEICASQMDDELFFLNFHCSFNLPLERGSERTSSKMEQQQRQSNAYGAGEKAGDEADE